MSEYDGEFQLYILIDEKYMSDLLIIHKLEKGLIFPLKLLLVNIHYKSFCYQIFTGAFLNKSLANPAILIPKKPHKPQRPNYHQKT